MSGSVTVMYKLSNFEELDSEEMLLAIQYYKSLEAELEFLRRFSTRDARYMFLTDFVSKVRYLIELNPAV